MTYDNSSADRRSPRKWLKCCAIVVLIGFILLPFAPIRDTRSRMDSVTGSMERQTTWPFGITAGPRVDASPLELRLNNMGVQWKREWTFLGNTQENLFGDASMYACGLTPPIFCLRPMLDDFVAISTDEEIRQFVQVMQTGTDDDASSAVQAATQRVFASLAIGSGDTP